MADVESSSATPPFCVWAQASRNYAIHIPGEVISSLGTESLVACKRVPRRGLETGGILLGRTEFRDDITTFWIEGFAPIESEHRFGPSYVLSDSDFAHLQTELTRNGTASIGIYRSQTRSEQLAIQDGDVGLFEKCFGATDNLFLMLAPVPRTGAFYFREDGAFKCVHQFPLVSSLSSGAMQGRISSPHGDLEAPVVAETHNVKANIARHSAEHAGGLVVAGQRSDQIAPQGIVSGAQLGAGNMPSETPDERRSLGTYGRWTNAIHHRATKLWSDNSGHASGTKTIRRVLAAITFAALSVVLLSYSLRRSAAPDHRAPNFLYLTVETTGSDLRLRWDVHSLAMRGASRAVLHIQDGDQQSDRELSPSELLAGQFAYQAQHSAVTFRLNVYAAEPNAIGLVQVMLPQSPIKAAPSNDSIPQPVQGSRPIARRPLRPIVRAAAPEVHAASKVPSNDRKNQEVETPLHSVKADTSKISPLAAREPSLPAGLGVEESRPYSANAKRNDVSISGRELTVRTLTTPVPGSRLGRLFGKIPLVGRLRKPPKQVEAVPVHQAQPIVRMPNDRQLIWPASVGVKVYVDESGAVNEAEVIDYGDPLNFTLANAALEAARNWTFAPSRIDDLPVASEMIIRFYFTP